MLAWPRSRDRGKCLRVALFESHEPEIFIGAGDTPTTRTQTRQQTATVGRGRARLRGKGADDAEQDGGAWASPREGVAQPAPILIDVLAYRAEAKRAKCQPARTVLIPGRHATVESGARIWAKARASNGRGADKSGRVLSGRAAVGTADRVLDRAS